MNYGITLALVLAGSLAAAPVLTAQAAANGNGAGAGQNQASGQGQGSSQAQKSAPAPPPPGGNPFPEDMNTVPVLPNRNTVNLPPASPGSAESSGLPLPASDLDPVRSPDDSTGSPSTAAQGYSSSDLGSLDSLLPGAADTTGKGKRGKKNQDDVIQSMPRETAKQDLSVGNYYLDNHDWKGALSRFQSALVLAPDNPDVYWGLAECERNLGDYASARDNYTKVMEYDPGSHHAKDAEKWLKKPEIANAKAGQLADKSTH